MRRREVELVDNRETSGRENGRVRTFRYVLIQVRRNAFSRSGLSRPSMYHLAQRCLPLVAAVPRRVAPKKRKVPARLQPAHCRLRDASPLQSVKRVANGDQLEVTVRVNVFGASRDPAGVVDAECQCFRPSEFDGLGFLIHCPALVETRPETESDLAGAACEI